MKNLYLAIIFTSLAFCQSAYAAKTDYIPLPGDENSYISGLNPNEVNLDLKRESKKRIELNKPVKQLNDELFTSKEDVLKHYLEAQKKLDIEDIKILWESTVQRNPIIKFALKKLSLPAEQRKINSSRMAKTISTLISGACMLPGLLGSDPLTASATSTGGSLAGRVINNKTMPKEMPLTDTELIHLARLVEDLQDRVIKNYYAYKGNLEAYKTVRENVVKHNKAYSGALESENLTQILTSKALYDKAAKTEVEFRQKIKLSRLQLERLAGVEAVNELSLGRFCLAEDFKETKNLAVKQLKGENKPKVEAGKVDYLNEDTHVISCEISFELEEEKKDILPDLRILWAAAVEKSETIRFAILKLSNPEGKIEKASAVKKILSPIASVAPIVGLGLGDPLTAGSAMFGGGLLNSVLSDDNSRLSAKLSKVTDTDLVMLAQETDALQEKLVILYYEYLNSLIAFNSLNKTAAENEHYLNIVQETVPELTCVANVFYEEIVEAKLKAKQEIFNKRVALEQFVGNGALLVVDKNIKDRLPGNF